MKGAILKKQASTHGEKPHCCWVLTPCGFRNWLLYHQFPYNYSVFGKLRDPAWWLITFCKAVPLFGVRPVYICDFVVLI